MKKHYIIKVCGKVQRVGFRYSCRKMADTLGIKGNVFNESDGGVHINAEGGESQLSEFIEWCRQGPSLAIVEKIEITEVVWMNYKDFQIL